MKRSNRRTSAGALCVSGIGPARWPDGPLKSEVAQGCNMIPVSSGDGEAAGGVSEAVDDEKIAGSGVEESHSTKT